VKALSQKQPVLSFRTSGCRLGPHSNQRKLFELEKLNGKKHHDENVLADNFLNRIYIPE
jgi:hypothetical protein